MKTLVYSVIGYSFLTASVGMSKDTNTMNTSKDSGSKSTSESAANTMQSEPYVFETWTFYFDQLDRKATTVYFDEKSSLLPEIEKLRLQDWALTFKQNTSTPKVVVASWSDKNYPAEPAKSLSKADKDLADRRNASIKQVLSDAGLGSVETYNMAVRPNWFQKAFSMDSAQIKGEAKDHHWDNKNEDRIAAILKRRGGPSASVIILRPLGDAGRLTTGR